MQRPTLALLIALSPAAALAAPKAASPEPPGLGGTRAPLVSLEGAASSAGYSSSMDLPPSRSLTLPIDLDLSAPWTGTAPDAALTNSPRAQTPAAASGGFAVDELPVERRLWEQPPSAPAARGREPGQTRTPMPPDQPVREQLAQAGGQNGRAAGPGAGTEGYRAGRELFDGETAADRVWSLEGMTSLPGSRAPIDRIINEIHSELAAKGVSRLPRFALTPVQDLAEGVYRYDPASNVIFLPIDASRRTSYGRAREEGQHAGDFLTGRLAHGDFAEAASRGLDYIAARAWLDELLGRPSLSRDPEELSRARELVEISWREYIGTPVESTGRHARAYWERERLRKLRERYRVRANSLKVRYSRQYNRALVFLMSGLKPEAWQRRVSMIYRLLKKSMRLVKRHNELERAIHDLMFDSLFEEPAEDPSRAAAPDDEVRRRELLAALKGSRRLYGRSSWRAGRILERSLRAWNRLRGRPARSADPVFESMESAWRRFGADPVELRHTETSKADSGVERITFIPGHGLWSVRVFEGRRARRSAQSHRAIADIARRWLPQLEIPEVFTYRRAELSGAGGWREQEVAMVRIDERRQPVMGFEHRIHRRHRVSRHWTRSASLLPAQLAQLAALHLAFGVDGFHSAGLFKLRGKPVFAGIMNVLAPDPFPLDSNDAYQLLTHGVAAYAAGGPEFIAAVEDEAGRLEALAADPRVTGELREILGRADWTAEEAEAYVADFKAKARHFREDMGEIISAYDRWRRRA